MSLLEHLSLYAELGLSVVPVAYRGKDPEVSWKELQRYAPEPRKVARWFFDGRLHNVGVVCGRSSGNFVAIDIDRRAIHIFSAENTVKARAAEWIFSTYNNNIDAENTDGINTSKIFSTLVYNYKIINNMDAENTDGGRSADGIFSTENILRALFKRELLDNTIVVRTGGGGCHVWLRAADRLPESVTLVPGIEIKSEGRIIVVPPSVHETGRRYEFMSNPRRILEVAEITQGLRKALEKIGVEIKPRLSFDGSAIPKSVGKVGGWGENYPCIAAISRGVKEGIRNEAAIRLASFWYRRLGLDVEETWSKLRAWNQLNDPPLDEGELRNVLKSEVEHGYLYGCRGMWYWCDEEACPLKAC